MQSRTRGLWLPIVICGFVVTSAARSAAQEPAPAATATFATVGEQVISVNEFVGAMRDAVRQKYYHGKVPEQERADFQRDVANQLIERALVVTEARRLGMQPDQTWVEQRLKAIEKRAERSPRWRQHRDRMLPLIKARLQEDSLVKRIEHNVQEVTPPDERTLRDYYHANPGRFTEPERFRVSAILLKVDPSSSTQVWKAAENEAQKLVAKLRDGASFADLARLHSGDASAERGGDMGYLHRGMLGEPAQQAVDAAQIGDITDPVKLLEGIAIFRVEERPTPKLMPFPNVRERAAGLWIREQRDQAWHSFVTRLRDGVEIHVNEQHFIWPSKDDAEKM